MEQIRAIDFFEALSEKIRKIFNAYVDISINTDNTYFLIARGVETWPIKELTLMFKCDSDFISFGSTPNFKLYSFATSGSSLGPGLLSESSTKDIKPFCKTVNGFLEKADPQYDKKKHICKVYLKNYWLVVYLENIEVDSIFVGGKRKQLSDILVSNLWDKLSHFDYNKNTVDEICNGLTDILWENLDQFNYTIMTEIWEDALKKLLDYTKNKLNELDY